MEPDGEHTPEGSRPRVSWLLRRLCVRCISVAIIPVRMEDGARAGLHHTLHRGNCRFFSPAERHRPPPTKSPFSIPITAEPQGRAAADSGPLDQSAGFHLQHSVHCQPGLESC